MDRFFKIFRILVCLLVGIFGTAYCMVFAMTHEDNYVFYELSRPNEAQIQMLEEILLAEFPEEFTVRRMTTSITFVPYMWQTVQIYYDGNPAEILEEIQNSDISVRLEEAENCLILSYFDSRSNQLVQMIQDEGKKHSEKLTGAVLLRFLGILGLMIACVLPYGKIYKRLNGL